MTFYTPQVGSSDTLFSSTFGDDYSPFGEDQINVDKFVMGPPIPRVTHPRVLGAIPGLIGRYQGGRDDEENGSFDLTGAMSGVAMGAPLGPLGMAAGGLLGGLGIV